MRLLEYFITFIIFCFSLSHHQSHPAGGQTGEVRTEVTHAVPHKTHFAPHGTHFAPRETHSVPIRHTSGTPAACDTHPTSRATHPAARDTQVVAGQSWPPPAPPGWQPNRRAEERYHWSLPTPPWVSAGQHYVGMGGLTGDWRLHCVLAGPV